MAAIDFVKWDTSNPRLLVWKFPSDQLATWTQLIVNDTLRNCFLIYCDRIHGSYLHGDSFSCFSRNFLVESYDGSEFAVDLMDIG